MEFENAVLVINKTRLEALIDRFNTKDQARFYIEHAGGNFSEYLDEHETFYEALDEVYESIRRQFRTKVVERKFVPTYLFSERDLVVVVGQDGLVANTAKYVNGLPILAVNPDPESNDGILLPFNTGNFKVGLHNLLRGKAHIRNVTLAEAQTNDGQHLLAFNDFFIGPMTHTSARYKITLGNLSEQQSSSGIIVSTGAGSTGWLSSVLNMANGVTGAFGRALESTPISYALPWDTNRLAFAVREPFKSRHSSINLIAGRIRQGQKLIVESYMPIGGFIFSDGVERDYIEFNSGTRVEIGIAQQQARLVGIRH